MTEKAAWVPISKDAVKLLPNDRAFTELEALYSLQLSHNNGDMVSLRGLAKRWGWSHKKARCFLPKIGIKIVYPQGTDSMKNQRGYIKKEGHNQGHKEGTINFIDFNKLSSGRGTKGAQSGAPINEKEKENNNLTAKDGIPHEEIVALYHEVLPECARVVKWTKQRQGLLRARWKEDEKRQSLDWWRGYFEYVRGSKFLMGDNGDFQTNLEWLIRPSNLLKVIEGQYHR